MALANTDCLTARKVEMPWSRVICPKTSAHRALCRPVCARKQDAMCKDQVNTPRQVQAADGESATISFLGAEGLEITVECPKDTYILDAGLDAGVELPYTCRGGICGACVGRVVEGEVDMSDIADLSFTLSDEEQALGLSLLCMCRPLSNCRIETQSDWGYQLGTGGWKGATGAIGGKEVQPLNPWGSDS